MVSGELQLSTGGVGLTSWWGTKILHVTLGGQKLKLKKIGGEIMETIFTWSLNISHQIAIKYKGGRWALLQWGNSSDAI